MSVRHLMYYTFFKRPCPAVVSGVDYNLAFLVVAGTIVNDALGLTSISKPNRPTLSVDHGGADFLEAHAGGYGISGF
jgi:hypothetical protein